MLNLRMRAIKKINRVGYLFNKRFTSNGNSILNTNLEIILVNVAAAKIFAWNKKKIITGTNIWEYLPVKLQKKMFLALRELILTSSSTSFYSEIATLGPRGNKRFICIILFIYLYGLFA